MSDTTETPHQPECDTRTDTTPKVLSRSEIDALTTTTSPFKLRFNIVNGVIGTDGETHDWMLHRVTDAGDSEPPVQTIDSSTASLSMEATLQHQAKRIDSLRQQLRTVQRHLRDANRGAERATRELYRTQEMLAALQAAQPPTTPKEAN